MLRRYLLGSAVAATLVAIGIAWAASPARPSNPVDPKCEKGHRCESVYSAILDFKAGWGAGANPNGVWTYGWSQTATSPLVRYSRAWVMAVDNYAKQAWDDPSNNDGYCPFVGRNSGGDYDDGNVSFAAGALLLHQGSHGEYSHAVWTAPAPGLYTVAATFYAQQYGINVDVKVLVNGKVQSSATITEFPQSRTFAGRFFLKAGQTIDFAVGPNGQLDLHPGHTGLEATITGTPANKGGQLEPVAYWPLNKNARDYSGNKNDGEVFGAAPTRDRFGRPGFALQFDGNDDLILVQNSPTLQIGYSDYTITAWIKTTDNIFNGRVFSKGSWNCTTGYMMRLGGEKVHLESASNGACLVNIDGNTTVTDGAWHFVAGVVYRHGGAAIYVDGVLDMTQSIDTSSYDLSNDRNPTIGAADERIYAPPEFFNGSIDDVRVFAAALSEKEIQALYLNRF